jgi:hypothetical protein
VSASVVVACWVVLHDLELLLARVRFLPYRGLGVD